jgi:hypothetical protein
MSDYVMRLDCLLSPVLPGVGPVRAMQFFDEVKEKRRNDDFD